MAIELRALPRFTFPSKQAVPNLGPNHRFLYTPAECSGRDKWFQYWLHE